MFGRKKHTEPPPPALALAAEPPPQDTPAVGPGRFAAGLDFIKHVTASLQLYTVLRPLSPPAAASVTSAVLVQGAPAGTLFTVTARVTPDGGDAFDTTFSVIRAAGLPPVTAGDTMFVVFDPTDHSRVAKVPDREAASLHWVVPEHCPECGAAVDQSVESVAAHPMCHFCKTPLPCHH